MVNKFNVEWRTNATPAYYDYMLCHNFESDVFFITSRCPVFSTFYVPTTKVYMTKFAKDFFGVDLPDEVGSYYVLGKGNKTLATKLKSTATYISHINKNCKIQMNGYEKFKAHLESCKC